MLYENFGGVTIVTQPRVIAATSLASRVAEEMHSKVGKLVGYRVRFVEISND